MASVGINKTLHDSLPKDQQELIRTVTMAEAMEQGSEFNARNTSSLDILVNKHGVKLKRYPDDLLAAAAKASEDVISTMAASDPMTSRVYESYAAFQKQAMAWADIGELGYMAARAKRD